MKNLITQSWATREDEPNKFTIHEIDKVKIRNSILRLMVIVPEIIR